MTKYAQAALAAAKLVAERKLTPEAAWDRAAEKVFPTQLAARAKSCPRRAFIALAKSLLVDGIPAPDGATGSKNGTYALEAAQALRQNPELINSKADLWARTSGAGKKHNSQMDVVVALWNEGYFTAQN